MLAHQHPGDHEEQAQGSLHPKGHEGEVFQHEEKDCLTIRLEFLAKTSFTNCNIAVQDNQVKQDPGHQARSHLHHVITKSQTAGCTCSTSTRTDCAKMYENQADVVASKWARGNSLLVGLINKLRSKARVATIGDKIEADDEKPGKEESCCGQ